MADLQMKTIRYPGINNLYRFMQPDGTYPDLTAGNVISDDAYNEDTEPYLFRALPYKSKRLEEDLVGAAVNWNQLIQNGNFANTSVWQTLGVSVSVANNAMIITRNDDGITCIYQTVNAPANHKYLWTSEVKGDAEYTGWVFSFGSAELYSIPITTEWVKQTKIIVKTTDSVNFNAIRKNGGASGDVVYIRNAMLVDLTAMFGSTIADYVYSLEQATAGSGIAWLKSYGFFTKPYYEYDAGTLKSVTPTAHKMVGVNQWDEEWEVGRYNYITGEKQDSSANIRNKNKIPVIPSTTYYISNSGEGTATVGFYVFLWYDKDDNYLLSSGGQISKNDFVPVPENAYYLNFYVSTLYGTTYNNDICINISNTEVNGKYFPYEEHTYDLGNVPLYGLFQLENNKLKAYGDVRHAVGGTDRKFGLVDLGTLTWDLSSSGYFTATVSDAKLPVDVYHAPLMICKYPSVQAYDLVYNTDGKFDKTASISSSTGKLLIRDSTYSDTATFKTAMAGLYLAYEKATTTTEDTPSFEKIQSCFPYGTEQYITTNDVPVGHETKYFTDVIGNIAGIPEPPSTNGTYELKLTVTAGVASYSWVAV